VLVGEKRSEEKLPVQEGRQKSTFNLSNIGKVVKTTEEVPAVKTERSPDQPINEEILKIAWESFIEIRKAITPDLSMLKRGYVVEGNTIKLDLTGNVEEMLFQSLKTSLIAFLRERTGNSSLLVQTTIVEQPVGERRPHTTKEKFNHLAEKNPVLKDLKERFGLDPDLA
jgi:DNA polymerase-3 subunit gamma/tau